jgi:predicted DNA binding CopG/RHH family protein
MENKNQDWKDYNLLNDEVEMLESIEKGQWLSIGDIESRKNNLRDFFSNKLKTNNIINLNLAQEDFEIILNKSNQYGINYKELLEKLVHNFAIGKVIL